MSEGCTINKTDICYMACTENTFEDSTVKKKERRTVVSADRLLHCI